MTKLIERFLVIVGLVTVSIAFTTVSARADHALQCDKVQLPSSLVICSDPDLLAIADERTQVYRELWAHLDADQRETLKADQNRWVREYANNCGVPQEVPPRLPTSVAVRECFKRAGQARTAFLREYLNKQMETSAAGGPSTGVPITGNISDEIPLENSNGIYMVSVLLNGFLPLPSILDSGAADVSLPADVVLTLFRTGTIADDDFVGEGKYRLADGSVIKSPRFYLREVRVGNHFFNRVLASLSSIESKPLLGQSFLSKIGTWSINNERHVLVLQSSVPAGSPRRWGVAPTGQIVPEVQQPSAAFQDGLRDRMSWEKWFAGTPAGFKDGAEYWADQRSKTDPGSCYGQAGENWTAGCLAAKRILMPADIRRKSEPEYRAGWNSYRD